MAWSWWGPVASGEEHSVGVLHDAFGFLLEFFSCSFTCLGGALALNVCEACVKLHEVCIDFVEMTAHVDEEDQRLQRRRPCDRSGLQIQDVMVFVGGGRLERWLGLGATVALLHRQLLGLAVVAREERGGGGAGELDNEGDLFKEQCSISFLNSNSYNNPIFIVPI